LKKFRGGTVTLVWKIRQGEGKKRATVRVLAYCWASSFSPFSVGGPGESLKVQVRKGFRGFVKSEDRVRGLGIKGVEMNGQPLVNPQREGF